MNLNRGTLASAIRVNRSCHDLVVPLLYRKLTSGNDVEDLGPFAIFDQVKTAKAEDGDSAAHSDSADAITPQCSTKDGLNTNSQIGDHDKPRPAEPDDANGGLRSKSADAETEEDPFEITATRDAPSAEIGSDPDIDSSYSVSNILQMFQGIDLGSFIPVMNALMGRGRSAEWSHQFSSNSIRAIESIRIVSLAAHGINHLSHGLEGDHEPLFDKLKNLEVLHIAPEQSLAQYEMQNPDAIPPFRREWVYCWHLAHEECDMVKHFQPRMLVLSDMPQLLTTRMEGFGTAAAIPNSVETLIITLNLADYECRVHNYSPTFVKDLKPSIKHIILIFAHMPARDIDKDDNDAPGWSSEFIIRDVARFGSKLDCKITIAGLSGCDAVDGSAMLDWEEQIRAEMGMAGGDDKRDGSENQGHAAAEFVQASAFVGETWAEIFDGTEPEQWL